MQRGTIVLVHTSGAPCLFRAQLIRSASRCEAPNILLYLCPLDLSKLDGGERAPQYNHPQSSGPFLHLPSNAVKHICFLCAAATACCATTPSSCSRTFHFQTYRSSAKT
uniref:Uncharacterized protein n=1 Tax=Trypanosoma congolense (strain IL3000) TaxID=1068625 RepID=G0UPA1_TRYCI|nr:hypothetical protein, unlikely [Trypanosoma congolense IL3000]